MFEKWVYEKFLAFALFMGVLLFLGFVAVGFADVFMSVFKIGAHSCAS